MLCVCLKTEAEGLSLKRLCRMHTAFLMKQINRGQGINDKPMHKPLMTINDGMEMELI